MEVSLLSLLLSSAVPRSSEQRGWPQLPRLAEWMFWNKRKQQSFLHMGEGRGPEEMRARALSFPNTPHHTVPHFFVLLPLQRLPSSTVPWTGTMSASFSTTSLLLAQYYLLKVCAPGASASPGSSSEKQSFRSSSDPPNQNLHFNKVPGDLRVQWFGAALWGTAVVICKSSVFRSRLKPRFYPGLGQLQISLLRVRILASLLGYPRCFYLTMKDVFDLFFF